MPTGFVHLPMNLSVSVYVSEFFHFLMTHFLMNLLNSIPYVPTANPDIISSKWQQRHLIGRFRALRINP